MNRFAVLLATMTLLLVPHRGVAAIQCGGRIVGTGDSKIEVISKCGQPDLKETSSVKTSGQFRNNTRSFTATSTIVETWMYNCGAGRFIKTLTFEDGVVTSVQDGDYGSGPNKCM